MLPIIKSLSRNSSGATLAALQVAVTLAVCTNALFIIVNRVEFIRQDVGIDLENVIVYSGRGYGDDFNFINTLDDDLRWIRSLPSVVAAAYTQSTPLSGSGSTGVYSNSPDESAPTTQTTRYYVNEGFVNSLGLTLDAGRDFTVNDIAPPNMAGNDVAPTSAIISRALADELFPNQTAVGKLIYYGRGEGLEVIGVLEVMPGPWVSQPFNNYTVLLPRIRMSDSLRYMIRTEPGLRDQLLAEIEAGLQQRRRNVVQLYLGPMTEVVAISFETDKALVIILSISIALVLTVTAFGLVGLASSSVRQRTKQIGTRRALGARKIDVLLYFVSENWLTTTAGLLLGLALTQWVNYVFVTQFELEPLNSLYIIVGAVAIWFLGLLAVLGPALKAVAIPPATATRSI